MIEVAVNEYDLLGYPVRLQDLAKSKTIPHIINDIKINAYGILDLDPNQSLIIDAGAHVGVVSLYLAKKYPKAHILAVEPFPANYMNLVENIRINKMNNISPLQIGLTGDSRLITLGCLEINTGGAIPERTDEPPYLATMTLSDLMVKHLEGLKISFLKMDIEGFEYETLKNFTNWSQIHDLGLELHPKKGLGSIWRPELRIYIEELKTKPITGKLWTSQVDDL